MNRFKSVVPKWGGISVDLMEARNEIMEEPKTVVMLAAMADLHYGKASGGMLKQVFSEVSKRADVLLLCGDSTDLGLPDEAFVLVEDLKTFVEIPIIAVLGNHDFVKKIVRRLWPISGAREIVQILI